MQPHLFFIKISVLHLKSLKFEYNRTDDLNPHLPMAQLLSKRVGHPRWNIELGKLHGRGTKMYEHGYWYRNDRNF